MPRKHYADRAGMILADVVTALERGDSKGDRSVVLDLLAQGPFFSNAFLREMESRSTPEEKRGICEALLNFLRTIVQASGQGEISGDLKLVGPVSFDATVGPRGDIGCFVDGPMRDVVVLQFVLLLHTVGLRSIRTCLAPGCSHVFVKTYRREFCSLKCQKRVNSARNRRVKREREEQRALARQRRKARGV